MISYVKYHGAGNDFVVIDAADAATVPDLRSFAEAVCDRDGGIGADGLLILTLESDPHREPVRVEMALYQPDGSIAEMCGNGARIVARWAAARTDATAFVIDTPAGDYPATVHDDGTVTVGMGTPAFEPAAVPVDAEAPIEDAIVGDDGLTVTAVNTGVPHAVSFVDDVDQVDLATVAPPVRYADVFPEGANVTIAHRRPDGGYDQRTYERGVEAETRACGTGAVAIVAVAHRRGWVQTDEPVTVSPPGGDLVVTIADDGSASLRGPVEQEGAGDLQVPEAT